MKDSIHTRTKIIMVLMMSIIVGTITYGLISLYAIGSMLDSTPIDFKEIEFEKGRVNIQYHEGWIHSPMMVIFTYKNKSNDEIIYRKKTEIHGGLNNHTFEILKQTSQSIIFQLKSQKKKDEIWSFDEDIGFVKRE